MDLSTTRLRLWLPQLCRLAREAGARIVEIYHSSHFDVAKKGDGTPVTTADTAADEIIIAGLQRMAPDVPIVTEETLADIPFDQRRHWQAYWLVDPLDGTREFIERTGEFSVNIGLVVAGQPVLGVVYGPVLDVLYFGGPQLGAWKITGDASAQAIRVGQQPDCRRVAVSRRHGKKVDAFIDALGAPVTQIHMGSALKTCLVAEGAADFYPRLGPTSYWDTAAGHAVLLAAGGNVITLSGEPLAYHQCEQMLNPWFIAAGGPIPASALALLQQMDH
ncbi:MAG TPA: 3'(2'),5'-bisphosphate nucleotidase CysQ [Piscirickettsiaceae bacterium]|nr:3'(2'),5'-bisphosphate nucleotidase CysQ [Piscirickettsiaceae bacterium]